MADEEERSTDSSSDSGEVIYSNLDITMDSSSAIMYYVDIDKGILCHWMGNRDTFFKLWFCALCNIHI